VKAPAGRVERPGVGRPDDLRSGVALAHRAIVPASPADPSPPGSSPFRRRLAATVRRGTTGPHRWYH
jgi:hypothetical protein